MYGRESVRERERKGVEEGRIDSTSVTLATNNINIAYNSRAHQIVDLKFSRVSAANFGVRHKRRGGRKGKQKR